MDSRLGFFTFCGVLEEENRRLKRMYAEMSMQNDLLKEALGKKR